MKTDTLKFKVGIITLLLCTHHITYGAEQPATSAQVYSSINIQTLNDNDFFEIIVYRIKNDAIEFTFDLIESIIDKTDQYSLARIIEICVNKMAYIEQSILAPLRVRIAACNQGSSFHPIFNKTYALANDMAYTELKKLLQLLKDHQNSANAKKTTALAGKLNQHTAQLKAAGLITKFEQKLNEIYQLATQAQASILQKLTKEQVISDVNKKVARIQSKIKGVEVLTIISKILNKQ